jgi:hypothetical protein
MLYLGLFEIAEPGRPQRFADAKTCREVEGYRYLG